MKKQRTHLTPEEVKEFINLGVDFGETADVWLCERNSTFFGRIQRKDEYPIQQMETEEVYHLPAPTLLEMLEVLPKQVKAKGGIYQTLRLERYSSIEEWSAGYGIEVDFTELNILDACTDLLRWLCHNHPETLTKEEKGGSNE